MNPCQSQWIPIHLPNFNIATAFTILRIRCAEHDRLALLVLLELAMLDLRIWEMMQVLVMMEGLIS